MNDYSGYGYDGWSTGVAYGADDPLFGAMPGAEETRPGERHAHGDTHGTDSGGYGQWQGYDTGQTQTWDTSLHTVYGETGLHQRIRVAETGAYAPETETCDAVSYQTGTYAIGAYEPRGHATGAAYEQWTYDSERYGSERYEPQTYTPEAHEPETYEPGARAYDLDAEPAPADATGATTTGTGTGPRACFESGVVRPEGEACGAWCGSATADSAANAAPRSGAADRGGSRRRRPAKRSALLSVAVPSVAVVGVAACAAAAVAVTSDKGGSTTTQADDAGSGSAPAVSTKLDRQLAGVSRNADDFANRASRTQERLDLKERQAAERRKKAEETARKEALRPKFLLPVTHHGLSAYFGQAGVNWMSVHTGIDFPVSYGTPVRAATDGTVRTQWNASYGNMAIVTAEDGTETWYCHLSSTKIRSGSVQAGDVIAWSGNSGNSTGPHLHFEVHPEGGVAMDPLGWLLAKGLDPR